MRGKKGGALLPGAEAWLILPWGLFRCANCGCNLSDAEGVGESNVVRCKRCGALNEFYCAGAQRSGEVGDGER